MALTLKRQRFVDEYLVDLNATQAAIRAGYAAGSARQNAHRMLTNDDVQAAVAEAVAKRSEDTGVTVEWVLNGLKAVAERCMQEVEVLNRDGKPTGDFVFNPAGANRAYELIGKYLRMFTERVEHTGDEGGPIEIRTAAEMTDEELAVIAAEGIVTKKGNGRRRNGGNE